MLCVALYIIQAMLLCSVAVRDVKHPVRALAWLIIGIVLPFVGVGLYFVLYRRLPAQSRKQTGESPGKPDSTEVPPAISTPSGRNICRIVTHMTRAPAVPAECTVYSDGRAMYHALLRALRQARHSIDLEFYIFRADHIGMRVVDVLCEQARAGVRVRWIRDGVGSRSLPKAVVDRCEAAGIRCRVFYPVRFPWLSPRLNRRDHRKIVVVDGERAFVGGMNIGDEYTGQKDDVGRWRDTHLHIVGGGACRELSRVFERAWTLSSEERRRNNPSRHPRAVTDRLATEFSAEVAPPAHRPPPSSTHQGWVQTVDSGPDYPIPSVRNLFFAGLTQSESSVDIITPYFIPDTDLLTAMKVAVHKGVRVRLLVPEQPDHAAVGYVSRTFYPELLRAGIDVYLYQEGVLHAKVMIIDGETCVLGAANYDLRSFRTNYEVCQVVYSQALANYLERQFEADLQRSTPLNARWLANIPPWQRPVERVARLFAPLL